MKLRKSRKIQKIVDMIEAVDYDEKRLGDALLSLGYGTGKKEIERFGSFVQKHKNQEIFYYVVDWSQNLHVFEGTEEEAVKRLKKKFAKYLKEYKKEYSK